MWGGAGREDGVVEQPARVLADRLRRFRSERIRRHEGQAGGEHETPHGSLRDSLPSCAAEVVRGVPSDLDAGAGTAAARADAGSADRPSAVTRPGTSAIGSRATISS